MEFEKNYLLIKKIDSHEVIALACIIKNGPELNIKLRGIDNSLRNSTVLVYAENELILKTENKEFTFQFIPQTKLSIALIKDGVIKGFGGNNAVLENIKKHNLSYLFSDSPEDLQEVINNEISKIENKFYPNLINSSIKSLLLKPLVKRRSADYFSKYKKIIIDIFKSCPKDKVLESLFDNSVWARAQSKFGHIVVGIIFNGSKPRCIAFGYPSFNQQRNLELDKKMGQTHFVPLHSNTRFGYYLTLKLASTGQDVEFLEKK